jgi:hypothetical protein
VTIQKKKNRKKKYINRVGIRRKRQTINLEKIMTSKMYNTLF